MPFTAKIKRGDPFRSADQREIYAMCRRIAGAAEHCSSAGWREESGYLLYHFTTWAKARAMQHWIDRSGIAHRPMPKLGPTSEETAERKRQALAWGLATGAVRDIVPAYRRPGTRETRTSRLSMPRALLAWRLVGRTTRCSTRSRSCSSGRGKITGNGFIASSRLQRLPARRFILPRPKAGRPRCGAASAPAFADLLRMRGFPGFTGFTGG